MKVTSMIITAGIIGLGYLKPVEKLSELVALTTWNHPDVANSRRFSRAVGKSAVDRYLPCSLSRVLICAGF